MRASRIAPRISAGAPVYMAAVLEYITLEILDYAGRLAHQFKKKRLNPRFIFKSISGDDDMLQVFPIKYNHGKLYSRREKKKDGKGYEWIYRQEEESDDDDY
jgi:hypothetical protein